MNGKLYIRKRPILTWVTYFVFIMPILIPSLLQFFSFNSFVKYTVDFAWVLSVVILLSKRRFQFKKGLIAFIVFIALFLIYTLLIYLVNFQSIIYYLWGFRNNFRFYFSFVLFCCFFDELDAKFCLKFLDVIFWINAVVCFIQFFVLKYSQDFLGGIFGVETGSNAGLLIFFTIIVSKSVLEYMEAKESLILCFAKSGIALLISVFAELKFFFVVFIIIVIFSLMLTKFSWRKFLILFIFALLVFGFGSLFPLLFGQSSNISLEKIFELITAKSYATSKDLGRFTAIPTISETIMNNNVERIFGLGLGNCDTSSFAFCNTPFFETYKHLNYTWFFSAMLFLELGFVGLLFVISFFVICFVMSLKMKKRKENVLFCQMAMIMAVVCVVLIFYNSSLRTEVAYLAFFVLALPFISVEKNEQELLN